MDLFILVGIVANVSAQQGSNDDSDNDESMFKAVRVVAVIALTTLVIIFLAICFILTCRFLGRTVKGEVRQIYVVPIAISAESRDKEGQIESQQ